MNDNRQNENDERRNASAPVPAAGGHRDALDADDIAKLKANPSNRDARLDVNIDESFPASDPPSFMAGAAVLGSPSHAGIFREPASKELRSGSGEISETFERTRERTYFVWEKG